MPLVFNCASPFSENYFIYCNAQNKITLGMTAYCHIPMTISPFHQPSFYFFVVDFLDLILTLTSLSPKPWIDFCFFVAGIPFSSSSQSFDSALVRPERLAKVYARHTHCLDLPIIITSAFLFVFDGPQPPPFVLLHTHTHTASAFDQLYWCLHGIPVQSP